MIAPRATLRLQLHAGYTLEHAADDLPYFSRLGVSHLYLSPVAEAVPGSTHGYDVVDATRVDAARGGEPALRALANEARARGMGLLLDIVPNHMAASPANAWWWDVLARGPSSPWAQWFDIDWQAPTLMGKVLAPFLDKPYDDALHAGEIRLDGDRPAHGLQLVAQRTAYPLAPGSLDTSVGLEQILAAHDPNHAEGRLRLHELLERQHYRLVAWQRAADLINWRRFFEVSGLIGVRVEREEVFQAVHALPLRLYAEGIVDGLRVDHVDGLAQPLEYCRRLRAAMLRVPDSPRSAEAPWVVIEKILASGEVLDDRWAVSGTTGYDFAADVGALQHAEGGEQALSRQWADVAGDGRSASAWRVDARQVLLERHFVAERAALLRALHGLAQAEGGAPSQWMPTHLGDALDALLRHYPVYRSYVEGATRHAADQHWFDRALQAALGETGMHAAPYPAVLGWLERALGGCLLRSDAQRLAILRFQQLTPPLAAKALEDTVFYRYGRLLSRNEVGSEPEVFSISVDDFHRANAYRARISPWGLIATATHDHKRGEDVRARLAVLSEVPDEWRALSDRWLAWGEGRERVPPSVRYMLLQMVVGAWPPELALPDAAALEDFLKRIGDWLVKALREGKQFSSWFRPDLQREQDSLSFLNSLGDRKGEQTLPILAEIEAFVRRLDSPAVVNGLVQSALRLTCPGVPDLYQGTEFRDFTLVDPDNRRPVDVAGRARALSQAPVHPLVEGVWPASAWVDGRVKQALIASLLHFRRDHSAVFDAAYTPLEVVGAPEGTVIAFRRGDALIVVAAVKCAAQVEADEAGCPRLPKDFWGDARLPALDPAQGWQDLLRGGEALKQSDARLERGARLADLLAGFPLAILYRDQG